jgi:hypothetical protein
MILWSFRPAAAATIDRLYGGIVAPARIAVFNAGSAIGLGAIMIVPAPVGKLRRGAPRRQAQCKTLAFADSDAILAEIAPRNHIGLMLP